MAEQKLLAEQQKEKELELQYNKEQEKFKNRWVQFKNSCVNSWLHVNLVDHQACAYINFCSMKQVGVFVLSPPPLLNRRLVHCSIKFILGERNCEGTVSCPKTIIINKDNEQ